MWHIKTVVIPVVVGALARQSEEGYGRKHQESIRESYYDRDSKDLHAVGAELGGGCRGCAPPPLPDMTCGFLIQVVFCQKKNMWFIGVEVEQETSAPPPKKNLGSAPVLGSA